MGETPAKPAECPICAKPVTPRYRPFCSKRCADVDLARWLGGNYRVPTEEIGPGDGGDAGPDGPDFGDRQD